MEVLCDILNRYHLQMSSFGQTLKHVRTDPQSDPPLRRRPQTRFCCLQGQRRIEQAVQGVDMDKDVRTLVEQSSITTEDTRTELLMTDYFVSLCVCVCVFLRGS